MSNISETVRLNVEELPEIDTAVAICGAAKQQEVGGPICIGIFAGVAIYYSGNEK